MRVRVPWKRKISWKPFFFCCRRKKKTYKFPEWFGFTDLKWILNSALPYVGVFNKVNIADIAYFYAINKNNRGAWKEQEGGRHSNPKLKGQEWENHWGKQMESLARKFWFDFLSRSRLFRFLSRALRFRWKKFCLKK